MNYQENSNLENLVNLKLLGTIKELILNGLKKEKEPEFALLFNRNKENTLLVNNKTEEYYDYLQKFGYVGEVLERYEEKIGKDIKNMRAIALALGIYASYLTEDMFVNYQKEKFVSKLKKVLREKRDLYLLCALYRMQEPKDKTLYREILEWPYEKTEEVMFVLSELDDDAHTVFGEIWPQIAYYLSEGRTLPVMNNIDVYSWFLCYYGKDIKDLRKKGSKVFKSLLKLTNKNIYLGSDVYTELSHFGFSDEEIAYANYMLKSYGLFKDDSLKYSIPREKCAAQFALCFLNASKINSKYLRDLLKEVLNIYKEFRRKYSGHNGIFDAISEELCIKSPQCFIILSGIVSLRNKSFMAMTDFDLLDSKWDLIRSEFSHSDYTGIIVHQIIEKKEVFTEEKIYSWMNKYSELTKEDFIYNAFGYESEKELFSFFVQKGIFSLYSYFNDYILPDKGRSLNLSSQLVHYLEQRWDKTRYCFLEEYLKEHRLQDLTEYFYPCYENRFLHTFFLKSKQYSYKTSYDLPIPVLSDEENRKLIEWVLESAYLTEPIVFEEALISLLLKKECIDLYGVDVLRPLAEQLMERGAVKHNDEETFRRMYLSDEEREVIELHEKALKLKAEREETERDFNMEYKGNFKSLYEIERYNFSKNKLLSNMVFNKMTELKTKNSEISQEEINYFVRLCCKLYCGQVITVEELKSQITML